MSEQFSHNASAVQPQADTDVVALIKKMQQQLVFLEKKIDTLISQSQERPFRGKPFSKPYRPFGYSQPHGRGEHQEGSRDRGSRDRDFDKRRHFEKPQADDGRGFGQRKKPFFHRGKNRGQSAV